MQYKLKSLIVNNKNYIINPDGSITIKELIVDLTKISTSGDKPPEDKQKPEKTKPDKTKVKKKSKHMTEKRVQELIDKSIAKNNVYLLSEIDKRIDKKIEQNNFILLRSVRDIVEEVVAPIHSEIKDIREILKRNNIK